MAVTTEDPVAAEVGGGDVDCGPAGPWMRRGRGNGSTSIDAMRNITHDVNDVIGMLATCQPETERTVSCSLYHLDES